MRKLRLTKFLKLKFGLMKWYGQNQEDRLIDSYFGDFKGTLLSIGENDGQMFSNVLHFIEKMLESGSVRTFFQGIRATLYAA